MSRIDVQNGLDFPFNFILKRQLGPLKGTQLIQAKYVSICQLTAICLWHVETYVHVYFSKQSVVHVFSPKVFCLKVCFSDCVLVADYYIPDRSCVFWDSNPDNHHAVMDTQFASGIKQPSWAEMVGDFIVY